MILIKNTPFLRFLVPTSRSRTTPAEKTQPDTVPNVQFGQTQDEIFFGLEVVKKEAKPDSDCSDYSHYQHASLQEFVNPSVFTSHSFPPDLVSFTLIGCSVIKLYQRGTGLRRFDARCCSAAHSLRLGRPSYSKLSSTSSKSDKYPAMLHKTISSKLRVKLADCHRARSE